jgi:hypothetical protein
VLFFLGLLVLLYRFLNGARCLVDHRLSRLGSHFSGRGRSCLNHFGSDNRFSRSSSGSQFGFLLQTLGFTLATTHFTWVVRCTATWRQGADRSGFDYRSRHLGNDRSFNDWRFNHRRWSRFCGGNHRLGYHGFSGWSSCFSDGWLGHPVERRLLFTYFANGFGHGFDDGFCNLGGCFNRWSRFGSCFNGRLCLGRWRDFDFWQCSDFDRRGRFHDWRFDWSSFQGGGSGAFGLHVGFCFSRSADHAAGNGCGDSQAGGQIGYAWRFGVFAGLGLFRTFDHVAIGITLTLATVAATTLATGTAAWTIAFGVFLTVFLQLLFVGGQFFLGCSCGYDSLLGTWLTFFTRRAWSALFTWLASRTLFSRSSGGRSGIQRFAQFTNAFFALATWLAIFTRSTRCTFFTRRAWCAFFASDGRRFFTGLARFAHFA